jgi:hypothetical protein
VAVARGITECDLLAFYRIYVQRTNQWLVLIYIDAKGLVDLEDKVLESGRRDDILESTFEIVKFWHEVYALTISSMTLRGCVDASSARALFIKLMSRCQSTGGRI